MDRPIELDLLVPSSGDGMQMTNGNNEKLGMVEFSHNASLPEGGKGKRRTPTWCEVWVDFTQNTTIHGLRFVWMQHAFLARKLLWLVLVMGCACVMSYQIIDRIIYYYDYPVTVNVNVNFNKTLLFPSITICNQNSFRATRAAELGRYRLLEAMFTGREELNTSVLDHFNASDVTLDELYLSVAHDKHDLIVDCQWQNMKCGPENFTEILTDHGVCFTFNSNHGQPLYVLSTGAEYGLKLTLNVEQYEYMPGPHDAAGVKMLLHDSKEFPGVAELGLAMPTGTHAYVGIQVVQIENLPEPHGDCASQSSPYYQDYSYDNCQMACLTGLLEDTCGCRNHFMPHTLGAPPICTLEQYYGCYMKVIDELKQRVREDCACPVPCDFLIFDPALSFATTSVFATDRLLAAAWRSGDLGERYLAAMETTQRMERIKLSRFQALERDAQLRLHNLSDVMLRGVKDTIERAEVTLGEVSNATRSVWDRKHYLYRWQAYHVQKNFIRARDAMDERTFDYLAMGFQEIGNLTASRIWALADPNVTSPGARKALYLTVVTSLHAKMDLCDRALDNYTQLYSAYFNGTPIFRYKFVRELRNDNVFVTPTHLLHTALNHNSYSLKYGARLGTDIERFRDTLARFVQLATQAFDNGTVDTEDMYHADVQFMWRGRRYLHSKSTFDEECIEYPLRVLEDRMTSFERLLRNYDDIMTESLRNIVSLKASLADLEDSILTRLNHSMRLASDYFTVGNLSKLEIARELTSQNIYVGISDLKVFFQSLRSRGQKVYDNWDKIAEATNAIWQVVIDDEDMLEYYTYKNMTHFLRNATEVAMENREVFNDYRQEFDFRFLIGSSDSLFLKSLQDLMSDMEGYLQTSVIGTDFIRENFLQLDVFYREKSYEQITQQIGYDEFALLCDIGGSMGLFVGASVLSIGELIDLFLHHSVYRFTHRDA